MFMGITGLTGCQEVSDFVHRIRYPASGTASTTPSTEAASRVSEVSDETTTQPATAKAEPINYPFKTWQQTAVKPLKVDNIDAVNQYLTAQFGKKTNIPSVDKKSLDFSSNLATQYRYTVNTAPFFDIIDSPRYLELGWYYASPNDQAKEKKLAVTYAEYAYQLSRAWLGNHEGAKLIELMLMGDTVSNKTINGVQVAKAQCESFSCILVLKKH